MLIDAVRLHMGYRYGRPKATLHYNDSPPIPLLQLLSGSFRPVALATRPAKTRLCKSERPPSGAALDIELCLMPIYDSVVPRKDGTKYKEQDKDLVDNSYND